MKCIFMNNLYCKLYLQQLAGTLLVNTKVVDHLHTGPMNFYLRFFVVYSGSYVYLNLGCQFSTVCSQSVSAMNFSFAWPLKISWKPKHVHSIQLVVICCFIFP
jgi:hypothetical protein